MRSAFICLVVGLASPAWGGELDSFVALDTLAATSRTEADNSGPSPTAAADLGITVRSEVTEADDRLVIGLDYRGRAPVAGLFRNREQHLLYRVDAAWRAGRVTVGGGRFFAPSAIWLSMDGVRVRYEPGKLHVFGFAGRRAISLSRRNVPLNAFLPVVGVGVGFAGDRVFADVTGNVAGDRVVLGNPGDEVEQDVTAGSARARVSVRATDRASVGGQLSVANDQSYAVGPDAGELVLTVRALSLYRVSAFSSWRVSDSARLGATFLHQQVSVVADDTLGLDIIDPSFTDLRVRGVIGRATLGFVRPDVRLRLRQARTELRVGGAAELHPTKVTAFFGFLRGWIERGFTAEAPADHVRWQVGAGWERGAGQIEAGIGIVDRGPGAVSGRVPDRNGSLQPTSDDLSPFVLEAQNVAFARGFVTGRWWFAGADFEANLLDREVRAFVQLGLLGSKSW